VQLCDTPVCLRQRKYKHRLIGCSHPRDCLVADYSFFGWITTSAPAWARGSLDSAVATGVGPGPRKTDSLIRPHPRFSVAIASVKRTRAASRVRQAPSPRALERPAAGIRDAEAADFDRLSACPDRLPPYDREPHPHKDAEHCKPKSMGEHDRLGDAVHTGTGEQGRSRPAP
jgi:hypothetical protein